MKRRKNRAPAYGSFRRRLIASALDRGVRLDRETAAWIGIVAELDQLAYCMDRFSVEFRDPANAERLKKLASKAFAVERRLLEWIGI